MKSRQKTIGIFSLQGSFAEHRKMIEKLGEKAVLINSLADVQGNQIDGIILPGGESTTIKKLLKKTGLDNWLLKQAKAGVPIYGTCAGMIILADMGLIDAEIERNAYGSQLNSFEADLKFESGNLKFEIQGIFIRAPRIKSYGNDVRILAKHKDEPVLIRQNNILIGSFHPELTDDITVHKYFLSTI